VTEVDAANSGTGQAAVGVPAPVADPSPLDSRIDLARYGWFGVLAVVVLAIAAAIRFVNLDAYALTTREGEWAYDAWALFTGKPLPAGQDLPVVSPLFLLLQATTFFLFGVTDAIARSFAALTGVGLVALIVGFRPFLGRMPVLGMAFMAAISPTLVFASRTVDPAILIAFLAVLAVLALLRAGHASGIGARYWAGVFGASVAGMLVAGPEGISTIIALGIGLAVASVSDSRQGEDRHHGPVSAGASALLGSTGTLIAAVGTFVVVSLLAFSRLLSDASALEGFLITFSDWGRMMASQQSSTPTPFFFYAVLLYEFLAVVFAIVAVTTRPDPGSDDDRASSLQPTLLVTWFAASLVLHSLASGRQPDQTILVTLPLVLLGGIGLGRMLERIPWGTLITTRNGILPLAMFALFIGLAGVVTLIARSNDPQTVGTSPVLGVIGVVLLVVVPLGLVIFREASTSGIPRYAGWSALLVVSVLLGFYTVRSATQLAWVRADSGTELVAQRIPTEGTRSFVDQTLRLSRDLSLTEVSAEDNTGSYGISIAIDPAIEWPFAWYFRDFPDVRVVSPAGWDNADMVIAPTPEGMEDAGYVVQSRNWLNRVPTVYEDLDMGTVMSYVFSPSKWYDGFRYLFYREMATPPVPEQMSVGYTFRLSNQMNPTSGPFDLATGQSLGPGSALGQLDQPTGIAVSPDGEIIYIVDSGNRRIQRFGRDGSFIGAWSAETDQRLGLGLFDEAQQGASDIVVGPDGLIYVADTWNHRVMILDATGQLVRELGRPGEVTDTGDSPDPTVQPGLFYGPRGVAVANGEIYVTDTGNERVQVFAPDGTFLRAFGGYGSEPGKLIEPVGIAIGPDGNVYVSDTGNARISVFTPAGEAVTQIPVPGWEGLVGQQTYLKFGANGVLYISSPGTGEILAWNGAEFVTIAGGQAGGDITAPVGMALTPDGMMLVTEPSVTQVSEFEIALPEGFAPNPGATPLSTPQPTIPSTPDAVG
jgi:uncharacterized protein (TIGR03663 family)